MSAAIIDAHNQHLLNPEFALTHFQPNPRVEYKCSAVSVSTGFNYLHALVLGGPTRLPELRQFIHDDKEAFKFQVQQQTETGWTALMLASRNANDNDACEETVVLLLPFSNVKHGNHRGWTALMHALLNVKSARRILDLLLPLSDAKKQTNEGYTALMISAIYSGSNGAELTLDLLLPFSDLKQENVFGESVLIVAVNHAGQDCVERTVELLLQCSDVDVDRRDKRGRTALMDAVAQPITSKTENLMCMLILRASQTTIQQCITMYPGAVSHVLKLLVLRQTERATFQNAIKNGLSLEECIIQSYV